MSRTDEINAREQAATPGRSRMQDICKYIPCVPGDCDNCYVKNMTVRVAAYERATKEFEWSGIFSFACFCCVYSDGPHKCTLLGDEVCEDMENWQFDDERFAGGERE